VAGADVSAWLIDQGWAMAYRQYSLDYVKNEDRARAVRLGIWTSQFQAPWEWRNEQRPDATRSQPQDVQLPGTHSRTNCLIKGNISAKGERIYHMPGAEHYARTSINASKGERWFCSEAEARDAGWRRSRR
jgi:hypothetical protein